MCRQDHFLFLQSLCYTPSIMARHSLEPNTSHTSTCTWATHDFQFPYSSTTKSDTWLGSCRYKTYTQPYIHLYTETMGKAKEFSYLDRTTVFSKGNMHRGPACMRVRLTSDIQLGTCGNNNRATKLCCGQPKQNLNHSGRWHSQSSSQLLTKPNQG